MTDAIPLGPFLLRINIEHTPSPRDPKGADEYYKALGILLVAWGRLEGHFVACLLTLLAMPEGKTLGEKNLPMKWDSRAAMWGKAFDTLPILQQFKEAASVLLKEIQEVALDRHAIVHALWEPFNPDDPPTIGIVSIKRKKGTTNGLDIQRASISRDMIKEIGEKANRLNLALIPLSQFLTRYRTAQKPPPADIRTI